MRIHDTNTNNVTEMVTLVELLPYTLYRRHVFKKSRVYRKQHPKKTQRKHNVKGLIRKTHVL